MNAGLAIWRAVTKNHLTVAAATIVVSGAVGAGYFVVAHGYRLAFYAKFELAPTEQGSKQSTR